MKAQHMTLISTFRTINKKTLVLALAAVFSFLLAAPMAEADSVVIDITDDSTYSWMWNEDLTLGYSFSVGADGLTFNALAVFDVISAVPNGVGHVNAAGLNSSHEVAVWDSTGTLVVSATVDPGDPTTASTNSYGNWVYQTIAPTNLSEGTYTVGAFFLGGSDPVMVQQTAINNIPGVNYLYGNYDYYSPFTLPIGTYPPNEQQYFGPTLLQIPEPSLILLLGIGLGTVYLAGSRFKK